MSNKKKESKQKIYRVVLSKSFEYPSCIVSESNTLQDLHSRAVEDFLAKASSGNYNESDFDIKLESVLPFKIRKKTDEEEEDITARRSLNAIIKELAEHDTAEQFGELDFEKNPDIFDYEPEERNSSGDVIREEEIYLMSEVEEFFNSRMDYYRSILIKLKI